MKRNMQKAGNKLPKDPKAVPKYTNQELKTLEALTKKRMAWIVLILLLTLFSTGFTVLILEAFYFQTGWLTKAVLGLIDGTLAQCIKRIVIFLFPTQIK